MDSNTTIACPLNLRKIYTVSNMIGEGGYGQIYKLIRRIDKAQFVCKLIKNKINMDLNYIILFRTKGQHPNLITLFEVSLM